MTMSDGDVRRLALTLADANNAAAVGQALAEIVGAERWLLASIEGSALHPLAGAPEVLEPAPLHGFEEAPADPALLSPSLGKLAAEAPLHLCRLRAGDATFLFAAEAPLATDGRTLARAALKRVSGGGKGSLFRDRALSTISHDLRGPLNVIGFAASMLKSSVGESDAELVAKIRRGARQMEGMIRDLLDLGELEAGRLELRPEPTTLGTVMGHVDAAIDPIAESAACTLHREHEAGQAPIVADSERLAHAIVLLVNSACRHATKGEVTLRSGVRDGFAFIEVEDSGKPLDAEARAHLFEPTDRGAEPHSRAKGLALTLARRLVEAHEAAIEALESDGVRVRVTLPSQ